MYKLILLTMTSLFIFTGCSSKIFNIGKEKGYCEEHGCDYSDAGVCGNPYDILLHKDKAKKLAYERIHCSCKGALNDDSK